MRKSEARKLYRQKRDELDYSTKLKLDDLMLIQFQTIEFPFIDFVFSFYPLDDKNEMNSFLLTDYLHFRNPNLQICYPRTDLSDTSMDAVACVADTIFEANRVHLLEPVGGEIISPEKLDVIIVPMLICDVNGNRVGYGKGFYDRYMKQCRTDCIKIGVSYFEPVDSIEDADEFDVPLNFCITPERAYVF